MNRLLFLFTLILIYSQIYATDLFVVSTCMKSGTLHLANILAEASGRVPRGHGHDASERHFGYNHGPGSEKFKTVYLCRDPRDVLISYAHWAVKPKDARHWFKERFDEFESMDIKHRILYLLDLNNPQELKLSLVDMPDRIDKVIQNPSHYFLIKFEDMIGPQGGGNRTAQFKAFRQLRLFLNMCHITDTNMIEIADKYWGPRTWTFRKGQIGEWKEVFDDELKAAFKASPYRDLLVIMGYEKDNNW